MRRFLVLALVTSVVNWCFTVHSAAATASEDCTPVPGENLTPLQAGLFAGGVTTAEDCIDRIGSLLMSPSSSSSILSRTFPLSVTLADSVSTCSSLSSRGNDLRTKLLACAGSCDGVPSADNATAAECIGNCMRVNAELIVALATNASMLGVCSPASPVAMAILGQLRFANYLEAVLHSVTRINAITANIVNLTAAQGSTLMSISTSSLESPEAFLLVCTAMFPVCNGAKRTPLCQSVCERVQPVVHLFGLFTNTSQVAITALLAESLAICPSAVQSLSSPDDCLVANASGIIVTNSSQNRIPAAMHTGLCLNLTCPYPLRATVVEEHWNPDVQNLISGVHRIVRRELPSSSIPFNGSILPCGTDCVAIGFTDTEVLVSRIFLSFFSTLAVIIVICSNTVFFFNRERLGKRLVRRVLVIFTVAGGIASLSFIPAAYGGHTSLLCESDGTIRLHEPGPGDPRCALGATSSYLFVTITTGYFVAMAHSWFVLIGSLEKPNLRRQKTSVDVFYRYYRYDLAYAALAVTPPLILSIVLLAVKGIDANLINGVCSASVARNYYVTFYVVYFSVTLLLGLVFFLLGLRRLASQRKGITGLVNWVKVRGRTATLKKSLRKQKQKPVKTEPSSPMPREHKFSGMARHEKKLRREINRLVFQILIYILIAIVNVVCTVTLGAYLGVQNAKWRDQIEQHILCMVTSCRPDECPSLPDLQPVVIILPLVVQFASLSVVACWPFTREYLENVPCLQWLPCFRRERTDTGVSSSGGFDSSDTMSGTKSHAILVDRDTPDSSPNSPRHTLRLETAANGTNGGRGASPLAERKITIKEIPLASPTAVSPAHRLSNSHYHESDL